MAEPRQHHYLQEAYLARFAAPDGLLCVYDAERQEFRRQPPHKTARQRDYYAVQLPDGGRNTDLETIFSTIEGAAGPVIDKLDAGIPITDDDRIELAVYVAMSKVRVPEFELTFNEGAAKLFRAVTAATFDTVEATRSWLNRHAAAAGSDPSALDVETLYCRIQSGEFTGTPHPNARIGLTARLIEYLGPAFAALNWDILHSTRGRRFITSDNPVTLIRPARAPVSSPVGLLTPGSAKSMVLSPTTMILLGDPGGRLLHREVDPEFVREANLISVRHCTRFAIARDEAHLRSLVTAARIASRPALERVTVG
jgi:hypothetical protein